MNRERAITSKSSRDVWLNIPIAINAAIPCPFGGISCKEPHENFSKLYLASPLDALLITYPSAASCFLRRHQFFLPERLSKMPLLLSQQSILKILRTQYYYKFHLLQEKLHLVGNYQQIQVDQKALPLQGSTVAL